MDLHIDKKVTVLMIISLLVGGIIGGSVGFMAGSEEGSHGREGYNKMVGFDNQKDGEINDDQGGAPNSDEQTGVTTPAPTAKNTIVPPTTVPPTQTPKAQ